MILLQQLRDECDMQHQALHEHPLLAPLNDGVMAIERYKSIIAMFHAAYRQTELNKPLHDLPDAPVLEWLEADMELHEINALTSPAPVADVSTPSKLVGYLYVKQGSTLGGQLISRNLSEKLGLEPGIQNRFFYGYGKETGPRWQDFRKKVTALESQLLRNEVITSAQHAFAAIAASADRMMEEMR